MKKINGGGNMDYNHSIDSYSYLRPEPQQPKNKHQGVKLFLMALVGGLIGALIMVVIAPYYIYGTLLPWPEHLQQTANYQLPQNNNLPLEQLQKTKSVNEDMNAITYVAEKVGPSVVGVVNKGYVTDFWSGRTSLTEIGSGSGFIIDAQGYIVTNEHVIAGAEEVYVTLSSGTQLLAEVIGSDDWADLAVLKIDINNLPQDERALPVAVFGDSDKKHVGEFVIAIGNPLGLDFARTTTFGIISAVNRLVNLDDRQYTLIQTDAAINSGNSGGPLIDMEGNVIGINQIKIKDVGVEAMGFAIPSNQAKPIIEQLIRYGKVIRPYIGIKGLPMNERYAQYLDSDVTYGIYVDEVVTLSPAAKGGMLAKDIIIGIDGERVETFSDLQNLLYKHQAGDQVEVEVYRLTTGKTLTLKVTLESMPEN